MVKDVISGVVPSLESIGSENEVQRSDGETIREEIESVAPSEIYENNVLGAAEQTPLGAAPAEPDGPDETPNNGGAPAGPDVGGLVISTLGTTGDDVLLIGEDSLASPDTVNGLAGNDLIFGDLAGAYVHLGTGNIGTIGLALNIDSSAAWGTQNNLDIGDSSIPHVSVFGEGAGERQFFSVTVGAGETITLDIDHGHSAIGGGSVDTEVVLYNAAQTLVAENDDSATADGGLGSTTIRDSYLVYTNTGATQLFYIEVGSYLDGAGTNTIGTGDTYVLNVSVTGHAATNAAVFDNDSINGGDGNDSIYGNDGNDTLNGDADSDTLLGGSGSDSLNGGSGDDSMVGGTGADTLNGAGGGADTMEGEAGNDLFLLNAADNNAGSSIDGGADTDTLVLSGGAFDLRTMTLANLEEILSFPSVTTVTLGADQATFSANSVTAGSSTGFEVIMGTTSTLSLATVGYFNFSATNSFTITGDGDAETITAGSFGSLIVGNGGNDTLTGGAGNDTLNGGADNDTFMMVNHAGASDTVVGDTGVDMLDFSGSTAGWNLFLSGAGAGSASSSTSNLAFSGINSFTGSGFADGIFGIEHFDGPLAGGAGIDYFAGSVNSNLDGGADNDSLDLNGGTNNHVLDLGTGAFFDGANSFTVVNFESVAGGTGNDSFTGTAGNNYLEGDDGNDTLIGLGGSDVLQGDVGDDSLDGGADHDTLYGGTGVDTMLGGSGVDTLLLFGDEANTGKFLDGGADGDTLYLQIGAFDLRTMTLQNIETLRSTSSVTTIQINADQAAFTTWHTLGGSTSTSYEIYMGTAATLNLAPATFSGFGATNPFSITGDGDAENITAGGTATGISGNGGNDTLIGGTGNDSLFGGADNDSLNGGAGDDSMVGGAGADTLNGDGGGADTMEGEAGNDWFRLNAAHSNTGSSIDGGADYDFLELDGGAFDLRTMTLANLERLTALSTATTISLRADQATFEVYSTEFGALTDFEVFMGTTSTLNLSAATFVGLDVENLFDITGDNDAEHITGGNARTRFSGYGGNDTLIGGSGNDTFYAGLGADSVEGNGGDDFISNSDGADTLKGGAGLDTIFIDGDHTNAGKFLDGGADTDLLYLQDGAFDLRTMTVQNFEIIVAFESTTTVQMAADQATFASYFVGGASSTTFNVHMGTTSSFSLATVGFNSFSATNSFTITGDADAEAITGGAFGSTIVGNDGNDTLTGGAGTDSLDGGAGDDLFVASGGADTMNGGADNDTVTYAGALAGVTLNAWTGGTGGLANGHIYYGVENFIGSNHNDTISSLGVGSAVTSMLLSGLEGDDTLIGGLGSDTLIGGFGSDSMDGGAANDTFMVVDDAGSSDTLVGGAGTDTADFSGSSTGWAIGFTYIPSSSSPFLNGTGTSGTSSVTFSDIDAVIGSDFNDTFTNFNFYGGIINGGDGNDLFSGTISGFDRDGGAGTDTLDVSSESSHITFNLATGAYSSTTPTTATIANFENAFTGWGNDVLTGTTGANNLVGNGGNDSLVGDGGDDTLEGGTGNDTLLGGVGNDVLNGGSGVDSLDGGADNDTLNLDTSQDGAGNIYAGGAGTQDALVAIRTTGPTELDLRDDTVSGIEEYRFNGSDSVRITLNAQHLTGTNIIGGSDNLGHSSVLDIYLNNQTSLNLLSLFFGDFTDAGDHVEIWGNSVSDWVTGSSLRDVIRGEGGHDSLFGSWGNDTVIGGAGDDFLYGGAGVDSISGGADSDILGVSTGDDAVGETYDGGTGTDYLALEATSGGSVFNLTDDTLTSVEGLIFAGSGDNSRVQVQATQLAGFTQVDAASHTALQSVFEVQMGTMTSLDLSSYNFSGFTDVSDTVNIKGDGDNETITGSGIQDSIEGAGGADHLMGGAGNDTLLGGAGNDTLIGGLGVDSLLGGADNDTFQESSDNSSGEVYDGGAGTDIIELLTDSGNQTLSLFYDTLIGIEGFKITGANWGDITISAAQLPSITSYDATGNTSDLTWFIVQMGTETSADLSGITFTGFDGASNLSRILGDVDAEHMTGRNGRDSLSGFDGNDTLIGGGGIDRVYGGDANDLLVVNSGDVEASEIYDGGAGIDALGINATGGSGIFDFTSTSVVSLETLTFTGSQNAEVRIGVGQWISSGFTSVDASGQDVGIQAVLNIQMDGVTPLLDLSSVTVSGFTSDGSIDEIMVTGSALGDTIFGSSNVDRLIGNAGNDALFGNGGDDTLYGGTGVDSLSGGGDNDTFQINAGDNEAGETYDGGAGSDRLVVVDVPAGNTVFNLRDDTVISIESLLFLTGAAQMTLQMNAAQLVGLDTVEAFGAPTSGAVLDVRMGAVDNLDLSGVNFTSFAGAGDKVLVTGDGDDDFIIGGDAQNVLRGYSGADTLIGGNNADVIYGGNGSDILFGSDGHDLLLGGDGSDSLDGGSGNDTVRGEAGDDILLANSGTSILDGGSGTDTLTIFGAPGGVTVDATGLGTLGADSFEAISIERLIGGAFGDKISEFAGLVEIEAGDGDDTVVSDGVAEADSFDGGLGIDTLDLSKHTVGQVLNLGTDLWNGHTEATNFENAVGGSGDDSITGVATGSNLDGGGGNDTLSGLGTADTLLGGTGNDILIGGGGGDEMNGGASNDILSGDGGADTLVGGSGDDILGGGSGNDHLSGGFQSDILSGSLGNDTLLGDSGNDLLDGGSGADNLDGGTGIDTLSYASDSSGVTVNLTTNTASGGNAAGDIITGFEDVLGGNGDDNLTGSASNNKIGAGGGNDTLNGLSGDDTLNGKGGNDSLNGGSGNDTLLGGFGKDILLGGGGQDKLTGGGGNDSLIGASGNDILLGSGGQDTLLGGGGDDSLDGGAGGDVLNGGLGDDTLVGGSATNDVFVFTDGFGSDVITDFNAANLEDIDLSGVTNITSFVDLINNHLSNVGGFATIVDGSDSILLQGVAFGDVGIGQAYSGADFIF